MALLGAARTHRPAGKTASGPPAAAGPGLAHRAGAHRATRAAGPRPFDRVAEVLARRGAGEAGLTIKSG
jgi:hypothetical protein